MILDIDATGVTVKSHSRTFKVAQICVRTKEEEKDVEDAELDPMQARFRQIGADLGNQLRQVDVEQDMEVGRGDGKYTSSTGAPEGDSGPEPGIIPA